MNIPTIGKAMSSCAAAVANAEAPGSVAKYPAPNAAGPAHVADSITEQLALIAAQLDLIGEKPSVFAKKVGLREETVRKVLPLRKRS